MKYENLVLLKQAVAKKPRQGEPCNGCGACCLAEVCDFGMLVMTETREGPCPAWNAGCGLIKNPTQYAPVATAMYGAEAMSTAAAFIIGSGMGCEARFNGEPVNKDYVRRYDKRDLDTQEQWKTATAMWGIPMPRGNRRA